MLRRARSSSLSLLIGEFPRKLEVTLFWIDAQPEPAAQHEDERTGRD